MTTDCTHLSPESHSCIHPNVDKVFGMFAPTCIRYKSKHALCKYEESIFDIIREGYSKVDVDSMILPKVKNYPKPPPKRKLNF